MNLLPERPLPSRQLIYLSLKASLQHIKPLLLWLFITLALSSIAYFYVAALNAQQAALGEAAQHIVIMPTTFVRIFQLLYPVIFCIALIWLYLAMLLHVRLLLKRTLITYRAIIRLTNQHYFRFFIITLITFTVLGMLIPFILPFLFILPIILLAGLASALDDYTFIASFKHAWRLVWGNWWHTFIVLLLMLIIPLFLLALLMITIGQMVSITVEPYIMACGQIISLLLFLLLGSNTLLILYNDLRLRYKAQPGK